MEDGPSTITKPVPVRLIAPSNGATGMSPTRSIRHNHATSVRFRRPEEEHSRGQARPKEAPPEVDIEDEETVLYSP